MAKQANKMMIGAFVVIAVMIMAASVVVFGSGKFFKKTNKYILYFDGSVMGLNVGAPVLFQGVQVGSVTSIQIETDLEKLQTTIPVLIEIEPDRFNVSEADRKKFQKEKGIKPGEMLIRKGLRAVLTMQSFITGQLVIELGFFPEKGLCYPAPHLSRGYEEIPTCQSTAQRLASTLENLDLEGLRRHLESTMTGVDAFVNNPALTASVIALKNTLEDARKLVTRVDRQVNPVADDLKRTAKDFAKLARDLNGHVEGVATGLTKTMTAARGVMSEDSPLLVQLENTLQELGAMSRSIRQLSNYLDQHPEALIRGKGKPGGK